MANCRTVSVSIDRPSAEVYEFLSNPQNMAKWATAFCKSIQRSGREWLVKTSDGQVTVRFAERNDFGVVDHWVTPSPEVEIYVPMRVLKNDASSEVIFTLFRSPMMDDTEFERDLGMVQGDLETLKSALENPPA